MLRPKVKKNGKEKLIIYRNIMRNWGFDRIHAALIVIKEFGSIVVVKLTSKSSLFRFTVGFSLKHSVRL